MTQIDIGGMVAWSPRRKHTEKDVFSTSNGWLRGEALLPTPGRQINAAAKSYEDALHPSVNGSVDDSGWYVTPIELSANRFDYGVLEVNHHGTASTQQTAFRENLRREITNLLSSGVSDHALMKLLIRLQQSPDPGTGFRSFQHWLESVSKSLGGSTDAEPNVLDEFVGYVDQVEGATAFVTLETTSGEELHGEYPADELAALGIFEHRRFRCRTIEIDNSAEVRFEAIPENELTSEDDLTIHREVEDLLADGILDGDA